MFLIAILSSVALAQEPIYGQCNPNNYAQKPHQNKSFPIVPALSDGSVTISGQFYIIDGCSFGLRNYTGYNFQETKIYGAFPGGKNGILITPTSLTPSAFPTTLTFQLNSNAGSQANFNGFTEVRFSEPALNYRVVAIVSLPALPAGTTADSGSGAATGSGSGTTGSGKSNSADKSNAWSLASFLVAPLMGLFL